MGLDDSLGDPVVNRPERPWRDGTTAVIFDRRDFIAKLAILVPAPRAHLTRYHCLVGPSAAWRSLVVPTADANEPLRSAIPDPESTPTVVTNFELSTPTATKKRSRNHTWSELMKRVFLVDVLQCEVWRRNENHCGYPLLRHGSKNSRMSWITHSAPTARTCRGRHQLANRLI